MYELDGKTSDRDALIELYKQLLEKYPVASMEDPLHEEDFEDFAILTRDLETQIVGMPVGRERTSRHNRLLQIEEELGEIANYAGKNFARP